MSQYKVEIKTGDVRLAGTNARVRIQLLGAQGTSETLKLDNKADNFEQNKLDTFHLDIEDVGWIDSIRLQHDNSGLFPGWYVDWAKVTNETIGLSFKADFCRWLAKDEGDRRIDVTCPVPVQSVTLAKGHLARAYLGYDVKRRKNDSSSTMNGKETFSYTYKEGLAVKKSTAQKLSTGAKIAGEFFGAKCELTAGYERTATEELDTVVERTVQASSEQEFTLAPSRSLTMISLFYQDILTGTVSAAGVSMEFENGMTMLADLDFVDGWLSEPDVEAVVKELLGQQLAQGGRLQAPSSQRIPKSGARLVLDGESIPGAINAASVMGAKSTLDTRKRHSATLSGRFQLKPGESVQMRELHPVP